MVLDLLQQLSERLPDVLPNEQAKQGRDSGRRNRSGSKRLMIRLADRRKPVQADGYVHARTRIFYVFIADQYLQKLWYPLYNLSSELKKPRYAIPTWHVGHI